MGFMEYMKEANYNFDAQKEGWIYNWTEKFILENINIMTPEILETAITNLPPSEIYNNDTEQLKQEKKKLEQTLEQQKNIIITNNIEKGRGMTSA